ncbi:MAG: hypothetical protein KC933_26815 [Myxococcales bacterium]|nr:hypothetical protein [Myxococcales bacterium]
MVYRNTPPPDPLRREHRRLWDLLPRLLIRQSQLEALARRTPRQQRELVVLRGQVDVLRRQSHRISEVLRAEARGPHPEG